MGSLSTFSGRCSVRSANGVETPSCSLTRRARAASAERRRVSIIVFPTNSMRSSGIPSATRLSRASRLVVTGDAATAGTIRNVALVPIRHLANAWADATRARAAARYGHVAIYAIDNRILVERDGFWVLGGRQPDVVMTTDGSRSLLRLEVSNVSVRNRVRVSHGSWSETRDLAPDERWLVAVPLANANSAKVVNFRVEQGATIAGRSLGCRIRVVD